MNTLQTTGESPAKQGPIIAWIVVLFALTVLCALPLIFGGVGLRKLSPSAPLFGLSIAGFALAGCAPTIAALLVTGFYPGAGGARALLRQVKTWRVGIGWYGLVLIGPIVLYLLAKVIHIVFRGTPPQHWLRFPSLTYMGPGGLVWLVVQLMVGSLGEEYGWRGFGQPRLQSLYGALNGSIFVGILWSTWHIWPIITPGMLAGMSVTDIVLHTYVRLIATAVIYTWIYNSTKGSLFLVMVAHAGHNVAGTLIQNPPPGGVNVFVLVDLMYLALAIVVVLMTNPQTLTRLGNRQAAGVA